MDQSSSQYGQCLAFFGALRDLGVVTAVVSPGSRSTPLVLAADAVGLDCVVQHDERAAAFMALGVGKATRLPAVLIATSGTAGANYLPAVVEANHAGVPLIAVTADRPPEHRGWGAGQTIDQLHLFGRNTRWFHDLAVEPSDPHAYGAAVGVRAVTDAVHDRGPVHCNWPLREPLEPTGPLTPPPARFEPLIDARSHPSSRLEELGVSRARGLLVVGPSELPETTLAEIRQFAARHRWPVIADPASGLREAPVGEPEVVITSAELLLSSEAFRETMAPPETIVHVGLAPTAKAYRMWLAQIEDIAVVQVGQGADWADPNHRSTEVISGPVAGLFASGGSTREVNAWLDFWRSADTIAAEVVQSAASASGGELGVALAVVDAADRSTGEAGSGDHRHRVQLVVSSSMPIRDLDVVRRRAPMGARVHASRGASGIDGVVATALGIAHGSGEPTVLLIGDVAALHDLGGLAAAGRIGGDLVIVVIDNDGGGIFSFLPASRVVEDATFGRLFTTPHGRDLVAVARALGIDSEWCEVADVASAVSKRIGAGVHLLGVRTSVSEHVGAFSALRARVDQALGVPQS